MEDSTVIYRGVENRDVPLSAPAEAVDVCCDRLFSLLPTFVSPMQSYLVGAVVGSLALLALTPVVARAYDESQSPAATPLQQVRWVGYLSASVVLGLLAGKVASDVVYKRDMVKYNKQHYALVYWVGEYARAMRQGWLV